MRKNCGIQHECAEAHQKYISRHRCHKVLILWLNLRILLEKCNTIYYIYFIPKYFHGNHLRRGLQNRRKFSFFVMKKTSRCGINLNTYMPAPISRH